MRKVAPLPPTPDVIPALSRDHAAAGGLLPSAPPHHSTALRLDPRAILSPAQAAHPLPASPIQGEVLFSARGSIVPHEWRETSPSDGGGRRGWGHTNKSIHLIPAPKTARILLPSLRMGGLQANSGGGRRAQQSSLAQVRGTGRLLRAFAVRDPRVPFQKPAPRDGQRLSFYLLRGVCRLGVRLYTTTASQAALAHACRNRLHRHGLLVGWDICRRLSA